MAPKEWIYSLAQNGMRQGMQPALGRVINSAV